MYRILSPKKNLSYFFGPPKHFSKFRRIIQLLFQRFVAKPFSSSKHFVRKLFTFHVKHLAFIREKSVLMDRAADLPTPRKKPDPTVKKKNLPTSIYYISPLTFFYLYIYTYIYIYLTYTNYTYPTFLNTDPQSCLQALYKTTRHMLSFKAGMRIRFWLKKRIRGFVPKTKGMFKSLLNEYFR